MSASRTDDKVHALLAAIAALLTQLAERKR